mgnify:CR=1 FL=1
MKKNLVAMVRYNDDKDAFELWIEDATTGEMKFSRSANCCMSTNGDTEANYIHYSFITEILKCATLGYTIVDRR